MTDRSDDDAPDEPGPEGAPGDPQAGPPPTPRPLIERIGLAVIALLFALMFGTLSAASWAGGEVFLAVMGAIACLMVIWVGALTLLRP
jgi:hypothetical protein